MYFFFIYQHVSDSIPLLCSFHSSVIPFHHTIISHISFFSLDFLVSNFINYAFFKNFFCSGTVKVISAKLSKSGSPLVTLATRHAFMFDMNLMCWLRVADDCFPASNFASSFNLGFPQNGELAALQVDVRKFLARKPGWSRFKFKFNPFKFHNVHIWSLFEGIYVILLCRVTDDGVQTRAHLESQLASALSLKSPNEYRQCLLSYIRFLARFFFLSFLVIWIMEEVTFLVPEFFHFLNVFNFLTY